MIIPYISMNLMANAASTAIGWALTNAANPQNPNLSLLYQNPSAQSSSVPNRPMYSSQHSHSYPTLPAQSGVGQGSFSQSIEPPRHTEAIRSPMPSAGRVPTTDADLLMNLNVPYSSAGPHNPSGHASSAYTQNIPTSGIGTGTTFDYNMPPATNTHGVSDSHMVSPPSDYQPDAGSNASDVLIESQNINVNMLQHPDNLPFAFNGDNLPWLEYLPPDVASLLGEHPHYLS